MAERRDARYGAEADICCATSDVGFTLNSDRKSGRSPISSIRLTKKNRAFDGAVERRIFTPSHHGLFGINLAYFLKVALRQLLCADCAIPKIGGCPLVRRSPVTTDGFDNLDKLQARLLR